MWGLLKRMVMAMISVFDLKPGDKIVFDTSSLSHALEDFGHAAVSAYASAKGRKIGWVELKKRLSRRIGSESVTRRLVLDCDMYRCLVPRGVINELSRVKKFEDGLDILTGFGWRVEERYAGSKVGRSLRGFYDAWKAILRVEDYVDPRLVRKVLDVARREGIYISRVDAEGIALALQHGAILVTADERQAKLADMLGLRVIYTMAQSHGQGYGIKK